MYISKKDREKIKNKFNGKCAYSGTLLEDDWQVEHIQPLCRSFGYCDIENHNMDNMVPVQAAINHYKFSLDVETFKSWLLGGLHNRLAKLPKNPRTEKSQKHKDNLWKIANYFGITPDKAFTGKLYFEILNHGSETI